MEGSKKKLNRDAIKYIAAFTMLINHLGHILVPDGFCRLVMLDIGYFTAITMIYFMIEGYEYTRSKKKYAVRLAVAAIISQMPFYMAFRDPALDEGMLFNPGLNMMYTLLLCFGIIHVWHTVTDERRKRLIIIGLVIMSVIGDWAVAGPFYTILLLQARDGERNAKQAYLACAFLFGAMTLASDLSVHMDPVKILVDVLLGMCAVLASGYVIREHYSGRRSTKLRTFSKYFFYIFYPAHLVILIIIRRWVG